MPPSYSAKHVESSASSYRKHLRNPFSSHSLIAEFKHFPNVFGCYLVLRGALSAPHRAMHPFVCVVLFPRYPLKVFGVVSRTITVYMGNLVRWRWRAMERNTHQPVHGKCALSSVFAKANKFIASIAKAGAFVVFHTNASDMAQRGHVVTPLVADYRFPNFLFGAHCSIRRRYGFPPAASGSGKLDGGR